MKKIYLAGKITGLPPEVAHTNFLNALMDVALSNPDATVINPHALGQICRRDAPALSEADFWQFVMRHCICHLVQCDALYLLRNWQSSKGAQLERTLAMGLGMEIVYL